MRHSLLVVSTLLMCTGALGAIATAMTQGQPPLPPGAEAISLFGKPLVPPAPSAEARKTLEANLEKAGADYERHPKDPEAAIWLGRRLAYLGRYRDGIATFTKGIEQHPTYFKLYRHRGHRYITVREFDRAIGDLERAAKLIEGVPDEIEPDGQPNARNIPTSTSHTNIWYHLGLAYYLKGDFQNAARAYRECLKFSNNPDMLSATSHWLYMTLRRLGREDEAKQVLDPIRPDTDIIENASYHRLLLMYKGLTPADALVEQAFAKVAIDLPTVGYGVANWHFYNGRREEAVALFRKIVAAEGQWAAFGYVAAEADLKRLGVPPQ